VKENIRRKICQKVCNKMVVGAMSRNIVMGLICMCCNESKDGEKLFD
jgi:hypothetical protein